MVIRITNANGDAFLIENRRFDRTMLIGATSLPDYNNVAFFPPAGHTVRSPKDIRSGAFWLSPTRSIRLLHEGLLYASGRYGRTSPEGSSIPKRTTAFHSPASQGQRS